MMAAMVARRKMVVAVAAMAGLVVVALAMFDRRAVATLGTALPVAVGIGRRSRCGKDEKGKHDGYEAHGISPFRLRKSHSPPRLPVAT